MTTGSEAKRNRRLRTAAFFAVLALVLSLPACSKGGLFGGHSGAFSGSASEDPSLTVREDGDSFEQGSSEGLYSSDEASDQSQDGSSEKNSSEITYSKDPSQPSTPGYVKVWAPTEDGLSIDYTTTEVSSVTYSKVISLLRKAGVISSSVTVKTFARSYAGDDSYLMLDLSENFTSYLNKSGKEDAVMGSIVNTFLDAYSAKKILVTVKRYTLKTSRRTYSGCLTRYSSDLSYLGYNNDTPVNIGVTPTKKVAITFDDGPHYAYTWLIIDKLREYGAKATFFSVGENFWGSASDAIVGAHAAGHEIGIHGYTHDYNYKTCSDKNYRNEITKTANYIYSLTGEYPTLMRPVGGNISSARVKASSFAVVNWSIDSNDWRYKDRSTGAAREANINTIVNNVLKANIRDGDIILMHELYGNSFEAFCIIIEELYKRGFEVVTVSELLNNPAPGRLYYHGR